MVVHKACVEKAKDMQGKLCYVIDFFKNFVVVCAFLIQSYYVTKVSLFFLSFFLLWGGTCSLHMPALRPASQAGPVRNPRDETSVV